MSAEELTQRADQYTQTFVVGDFDIDVHRRMTIGAVLRKAQTISTDHCTFLGLTEAVYARTHTAFLLAKLAVEFYAPIRVGDRVVQTTRPSAPQHAVFHRLNTMTRPDGTPLCTVDSRWVLVDTRTKHILRTPPEEMRHVFTRLPQESLDVAVHRVPTQPLAQECAVYSRCDQNGHLNNTRYADIVCDHMPAEELAAYAPRRFAIAYHREVPLGACFALEKGHLGDHAYYFVGTSDVGKHFEAELVLEQAE